MCSALDLGLLVQFQIVSRLTAPVCAFAARGLRAPTQRKIKNMANPFEGEDEHYLVLVNAEGQYSLWPAFRDVPLGWTAVGTSGARQHCLDWIQAHWTDMRPKSLSASEASAQ